MKYQIILKATTLLLTFLNLSTILLGQLEVEGNGVFTSPASTNVDIKNTDDNTNALVRFGDNNILKASMGFNGNDDAFKISMGNTLGREDLCISESGLLAINNLPTTHRFLINHNSTSGISGSAHLTLRESNTVDYARLRFENSGVDDLWAIAGRATEGSARLNFFYNNGTDFANIMSFDGDNFRVGILTTEPEAYLHIKQDEIGIPAIILENDAQTGGEKWGIEVGNDDLELYFEGVLRGSFSSATGAYTAVPPPAPPLAIRGPINDNILDQVLEIQSFQFLNADDMPSGINFDPFQIEKVNPNWVVRSEDGKNLGINHDEFVVLAIRSIQEQQELLDQQNKEIDIWEKQQEEITMKIALAEQKISQIQSTKSTNTSK